MTFRDQQRAWLVMLTIEGLDHKAKWAPHVCSPWDCFTKLTILSHASWMDILGTLAHGRPSIMRVVTNFSAAIL